MKLLIIYSADVKKDLAIKMILVYHAANMRVMWSIRNSKQNVKKFVGKGMFNLLKLNAMMEMRQTVMVATNNVK